MGVQDSGGFNRYNSGDFNSNNLGYAPPQKLYTYITITIRIYKYIDIVSPKKMEKLQPENEQ